MGILAKYKLKKDLPKLNAGAIFEHREYDNKYPDRGNVGCGVLILGWLNGNTQDSWCGETYILPGQLAEDTEWFELLEKTTPTEKELILKEIDALKERVRKL